MGRVHLHHGVPPRRTEAQRGHVRRVVLVSWQAGPGTPKILPGSQSHVLRHDGRTRRPNTPAARLGRGPVGRGLAWWPCKAIRECRVRERAGRWYTSVRVEIDQAEYGHRCGDGVAGIDLGLSTFATIAYPDGTHRKVETPEPFRRSMRALRRAQRKLSRRKPGSRNRAKARLSVARGHRSMANIRKDFLHKLTLELMAQVAAIQVEGLSIRR